MTSWRKKKKLESKETLAPESKRKFFVTLFSESCIIDRVGWYISVCKRNFMDSTKIVSRGILIWVVKLQNTGTGFSVWMAIDFTSLREEIGYCASVSGDLGKITSLL